jgi:hypothetical protein
MRCLVPNILRQHSGLISVAESKWPNFLFTSLLHMKQEPQHNALLATSLSLYPISCHQQKLQTQQLHSSWTSQLLKVRELHDLEKSGTSHPVMWCHIPEEWKPQLNSTQPMVLRPASTNNGTRPLFHNFILKLGHFFETSVHQANIPRCHN